MLMAGDSPKVLFVTPPSDKIVRLPLVSRGPVGWRLSN
jgi:hypothetical protein